MKLKTLDNLNLEGKKILLRCDLNVPFDLEGKILPGLEFLHKS